MLSLTVQDKLRYLLRSPIAHFLSQLNYEYDFDLGRIQVWADVDKFKYKEDAFVWGQKRGKMGNIYSVYLDGIHICNFSDDTNPNDLIKDFWKGFLEGYKKKDDEIGKIFIDKSLYKVVEDKRKKAEKDSLEAVVNEIKKKKPKTEEQALAKEAALNVAKQNSSNAST